MRRILIDETVIDPKTCSYGFPWKRDSICINFNMPDECVAAGDVDSMSDRADISTLVIGCDLENYDFISDMVNLKQLYIYKGSNITSLDFVGKLIKLHQLYVCDCHVSDIDAIYELAKEKERLFNTETEPFKRMGYMVEGICIDSHCEIQGADRLKNEGVYIAELIVNGKRIG